jgi:hypothetical protein
LSELALFVWRRWCLLVAAALTAAMLAGCGGQRSAEQLGWGDAVAQEPVITQANTIY